MKTVSYWIGMFVAMACLASCVNEEAFENNAKGNFEALWRIMDEHYCFFTYKQQVYGLDWNEVHTRYAPQVEGNLTDEQLFEVLGNMVGELRDGHVNLYTPWDVARNWSWHENYAANYSEDVVNGYLGNNYRIATGMKYRILDNQVGYIRLESFANGMGAGNLDYVLNYLAPCNGLIIDIRENGGGLLTSAEELAARFTNTEVLVGYMKHKTGKGHNDFSALTPQTIKPGKGMRWQKQVVVLTNRKVYSAANEFVKYMKCFDRVTIVGDKTGGGAGLPFSAELPNGWGVRFSACPMYDRDKNDTEFGIEPQHYVALKTEDVSRGKDTLIEFAADLLNNQK